MTPRELGKSGGASVAKQLRLGPANAIKGALRTMTRVNSSSKPPKLPYASYQDTDMGSGKHPGHLWPHDAQLNQSCERSTGTGTTLLRALFVRNVGGATAQRSYCSEGLARNWA